MLKLLIIPQRYKFSSKSQQALLFEMIFVSCWLYRKGTNFRANHNASCETWRTKKVVDYTAKVQIFEQITTRKCVHIQRWLLLIIPQRYKFSSKSQRYLRVRNLLVGCWLYRKGTNFRANHNKRYKRYARSMVVDYTAKVQIFEQITTTYVIEINVVMLLIIPQRYKFSSKSQRLCFIYSQCPCCWLYRKGTNFRANHNIIELLRMLPMLLIIPQRYKFSSKSQPSQEGQIPKPGCWLYRKGTNFRANHN